MIKPKLKLSYRVEEAWRAWFAERLKPEPNEDILSEKWQTVWALMEEINEVEANAHYAKHGLRYLTALRTPEATPDEISRGVKLLMEHATSPKANETGKYFTFAAQEAWKQANAAWILDDTTSVEAVE